MDNDTKNTVPGQGAEITEDSITEPPKPKTNGGGRILGTSDQSWKEEAAKYAEQERAKTSNFLDSLVDDGPDIPKDVSDYHDSGDEQQEILADFHSPPVQIADIVDGIDETPFPDAEQEPAPQQAGPVMVEVHPALIEANGVPVVNLQLSWQELNVAGELENTTRTATLTLDDGGNVAIGLFQAVAQAQIMAAKQFDATILNRFFLRLTSDGNGRPDFGKAMVLGQRWQQFYQQSLMELSKQAEDAAARGAKDA